MDTLFTILNILSPVLQLCIIVTAIYTVRLTMNMSKLNKELWKSNVKLTETIIHLNTERHAKQLDAFTYTPVKQPKND